MTYGGIDGCNAASVKPVGGSGGRESTAFILLSFHHRLHHHRHQCCDHRHHRHHKCHHNLTFFKVISDKRKQIHQIDVERSLLKKSLERLSSDFAISAAHVSIIISEGLFKYLWTICSSVHCTNAQKIRLSLHIRIVQAIVKKSTQPVIICKCEFIIAKADGAAKSSEAVSYSAQGVFFQSVY